MPVKWDLNGQNGRAIWEDVKLLFVLNNLWF